MNRVKSSNVIIEVLITSTYYPVFCGKTMEFSQTQELIEVTSINNTVAREYEAGMTTGTVSISGVHVLDNTDSRISFTWLMQESIRRSAQTMRIRMTDDDGGSLQIAFSAIITNNTMSRAFGTYAQSSVTLTITGEPVLSSVVTPPTVSCVESPLYLSTTPGSNTVSNVLLQATGVTILEVDRSGLQHDETTGAPGSRQFKFTGGTGAGTLTFDSTNPFNSGETVYVLYKIV